MRDTKHLPFSQLPRDSKTIYYLIDFTVDFEANTGVQRVTRSLAKALIEEGRDILFVRWDEVRKALRIATQNEIKSLERWNGPAISTWRNLQDYPFSAGKAYLLHESPIHAGLKGSWLLVPEVTHITNLSSPPTYDIIHYAKRSGIRTAFIFYDAIPIKLDEYAATTQKHAEYMQHIALADLILPISLYAADDLREYYCQRLLFDDKTLPSIVPIPLAGEMPGLQRSSRYDEPKEKAPLILCVGTIEPRKNQTTLIDAFQQLCVKDPSLQARLVFVGNLHPAIEPRLREAIASNPRIEYLSYIADEELERLYQKALFTVFPSTEEGFGLPIIESLWHGKVSVCADFGAMAEVAAGGGCLTVDVRSPQALLDALERLLTDVQTRSRLGAEAVARQIKNWNDYAKEVLAAFALYEDTTDKVGDIYYLVDHTCVSPHNTCIQHVTRMLGRTLEELKIPVQMVKWDHQTGGLMELSSAEKQHLTKWHGPQSLTPFKNPRDIRSNSWLLIPEAARTADGEFLEQVIEYARRLGFRIAAFYHDGSHQKVERLNSSQTENSQKRYMRSLGRADLVFCSSTAAVEELYDELIKQEEKYIGLGKKLNACTLATELLEQPADLAETAVSFPGKTRHFYAKEIIGHLVHFDVDLSRAGNRDNKCSAPVTTKYFRPLLSICVTTYNRASWLMVSLDLIMQWTEPYRDIIEVVVCDNASTDDTSHVVEKYGGTDNFRYFRNRSNVGMLGNLSVTAHHASGQYVWLVGDDDLIKEGTVERIFQAILSHPRVGLVYLNYAYTNMDRPESIDDLAAFFSQSCPIIPPSPDRYAKIKELAPSNENFFTAIYTCVFRRDHALLAYSQNTEGRPFSSLLTCVPTTYHVCNHMFEDAGYWIGEPGVVVNMNVSWGRFAALWRLERLPEIYDLAEMKGALSASMDTWRAHNLLGITQYLNEIYFADTANNAPYFSMDRFILRHKHLGIFRDKLAEIKSICQKAHKMGRFGPTPPAAVFSRFNM